MTKTVNTNAKPPALIFPIGKPTFRVHFKSILGRFGLVGAICTTAYHNRLFDNWL